MAQEVIEAPITGKVISLEVAVGYKVDDGDVILYIESMKMENPILTPVAGTVTEIKVSVDQVVETGAVLAVIDD